MCGGGHHQLWLAAAIIVSVGVVGVALVVVTCKALLRLAAILFQIKGLIVTE